MGKRVNAAIALTSLVTTAGLIGRPSSAMASGGGCIDYSKNGWNVGVCSSDNGSRVYGDIYVNARGSLGSSCYITFYINKSGGGLASNVRHDGCYSGHHSATSAPMSSGCYYNSFEVVVNDTIKDSGTSPLSCK
ncbi:hypothetical protein ACGFIW_33670 [Micromonospora sp. NPDC048935]|uniref:hypothetical protein n=1 Tax=Micromonospora sp. NPDC048935 TaxID=3364262 RepID=UPI003721C1EB